MFIPLNRTFIFLFKHIKNKFRYFTDLRLVLWRRVTYNFIFNTLNAYTVIQTYARSCTRRLSTQKQSHKQTYANKLHTFTEVLQT